MTLAQPESYFVSSARLAELDTALQHISMLEDLDALNVVKVLAARWPVDPKKAKLILEKILSCSPSVMGRTLQGTPLLITLADSILSLQSDGEAAAGLETLAEAPNAHPSLVSQIPSFKAKLMAHVVSSPARVLPALFRLPLSPRDITNLCSKARLATAPPQVLAKGISLGPQWINMCVFRLATCTDDEETALLMIQIIANVGSFYVSQRIPEPDFKAMPISKSLFPLLEQALVEAPSLGSTLKPLDWPALPPHLLHYQRAIDQARAIKRARPGDWDADLAAVFPDMSSTGNLAAGLAASFEGLSAATKLEVLEKLEAAASAEPQQGTNPEMPPEWLSIFTTVCEAPDLLTDGTLRLAACKALTAALGIWQPSFELSHDNVIGSWLIGCLKSSARDLRVQATRSIGAFVTANTGEESKLALFRFLTMLMTDSSFETPLLAWTEAAVVADSERLNMLLLRMIELLGGPAFRAALVSHQLRTIAARKGTTPWQLCAPFWATISVAVVRRLQEQDVLVMRFCSLLGVNESDLLIRTCQYTLPDLTLRRQNSTVRMIADAVGCTTKKLYLDYAAPILSRLMLQQSVSQPIQFAEKRWRELDPGFASMTFQGVLQSNLPELYFELLKEAPPEGADPAREKHIIKLIHDLAHGDDPFSITVVYKLVNMFSDTMRNFRGRQPYTTKLQCLRGLDLLIRTSQKSAAGLVAQVSAFLQAALDIPELEAAAFRTWQTMVERVEGVHDLIDLVFSVISQRWSTLTSAGKTAARQLSDKIMADKRFVDRVISKSCPTLPESLPAAAAIDKVLVSVSPYRRLRDLVARSHQDNIYVIRQMVLELAAFAANNQDVLSKELAVPHGRELLGSAVRALLNICQRFPNRSQGIIAPCVQCLCFIGALDPTYIDIRPENNNPIVVSNFEDGEESAKFAGFFVVHYLYKAYEASTDPAAQKFVLYGIQEYLKFCKLSVLTADSVRGRRRWDELIGTELYPALSPLLSTKYVSPMAPLSTKEYPIFRGRIEYSAWLADFCSDLMCRVVGANAEEIFALCRRVVRDKEQSMPVFTFMLPYVALNAVLANEDNRQVVLKEVLTVLSVRSSHTDDVSAFHERIFAVLDYFGQWIRASRQSNRTNQVKVVEALLNDISPAAMAQRAFDCRSYPRALRYWEQSLREEQYGGPSGPTADFVYEKMREMYADMGDSDSLEGVSTKFAVMNLDQQILGHETLGRWNAALACYEVLGRWDLKTQEGMLRCLHSAGRDRELLARFATMSQQATGAGLAAAAAWQVADIPALEHWSRETNGHSTILEGHVGRALLALRHKDEEGITRSVDSACTAAGVKLPPHITSLAQIRRVSVYLHGIGDLAQIAAWNGTSEPQSPSAISHHNKLRLARVGPDYAARSYLLSLRRAAFQASSLPSAKHEIAETFYLAARDARKQGDATLALSNVLEAKRGRHALAVKEHAKLLWSQGETRQAIKMLRDEVDPLFLESVNDFAKSKVSMETAKTALLYTTWLDQAGQMRSQDLIVRYTAIVKVSSKWEKAYYMLAKHVTRVYHAQLQLPANSRSPSYYEGTLTKQMVNNFTRSLANGSKYVAESLPKLLTLWLDFATNVTLDVDLPARNLQLYNRARQQSLQTMNEQLMKYSQRVPGYLWYLGVPQLLSRITQQEDPVYQVMKTLIVTVVRMYPEQALWSIVEVTHCSPTQEKRRARGQDILQSLVKTPTDRSRVRELVPSALALVKALRTICYYRRGKERLPPILKLSQIDVSLSSVPCPLVVPVQRYLTCILPEQKAAVGGERHSPFPSGPTIYSIDNEASVQNSLQQPKRLNIWGTDGLKYMLLCKGTDDVRKDARLIEFSTTINRLLEGDPEATTRHLGIAAYRVTPIDEASGVIEWVDGAQPIRHIIEKNLVARGIKVNLSSARNVLGRAVDAETRMQNFLALCENYPPVLYDWFISTFPDPEAWLHARARYARSAAVMSMVGYILGLGDRHLENLLLLQDSGTLLHVDFDCLFDKGATFAVPEVVPFRLTQNMVDALGVYGYEGPFRKACEITLGLLRNNEELLMTVLEAFLYDPVVGPSKDRGPEKSLEAIRDKLRGIRFKDSAPFSVPGQVEDLIQQAVSPENLSRMYVGWAAFL